MKQATSIPGAVFLLCLVLFSCNKDENRNVYDVSAVVESYLTPGQPMEVTISKEIPYVAEDNSGVSIEELAVTVTANGQATLLTHIENGRYASADHETVTANTLYELAFDFNDETVSAITNVPRKPQGFYATEYEIELQGFSSGGAGPGSGSFPSFDDNVSLFWDNPEGDYHLVVVENLETDPEPVNDVDDDAIPVIRNEPDVGNSFEIRTFSFAYYGTHRVVLYRLNPEYAALYLDNGTSSQNLQNPPGNIENGLGIFTALNTDTLFIEVTKP